MLSSNIPHEYAVSQITRLSKGAVAAGTGAELMARVVLVPQQRHQDFLKLLAFADVIVDTHPFGKLACQHRD